MFTFSKIAQLLIQCLVQYINIYTCGSDNSTYYGETDRNLKVRSAEHIGISPWRFKKTKPSKVSGIRDHFLNCHNIPSFEESTILANRNNNFVIKIKESLLIEQEISILNKNISSAKLFLFDNNQFFNRFCIQQYCLVIIFDCLVTVL